MQRNCESPYIFLDFAILFFRHVRIENKNFYFACKKNAQGRYITVSEIKGNFRNSILIPESGWDDFRLVFEEYVKQCQEHD